MVSPAVPFIPSGHFYSAPSSPLPLRGTPDYSTDTVSEFHAEAHGQLQVKKGLAQGPYVAARAGVESTTLRLKVNRLNQGATRIPLMRGNIQVPMLRTASALRAFFSYCCIRPY